MSIPLPGDDDHPRVRRPSGGWGRISARVMRDATIPTTAKALYGLLATYADDGDRECHPKQQTLAEQLGVSRSTLQAALYALRDLGLITIEDRYREDGGQMNSDYTLLDELGEGALPVRHPRPADRAAPRPTGEAATTRPVATRPHNTDGSLASLAHPGPPGMLDGMPADPLPTLTAGTIVSVWCAAWSAARGGQQPDRAVVQRVTGTAGSLARSRTDEASWIRALDAAREAGKRGRHDVTGLMEDPRWERQRTPSGHIFDFIEQLSDQPLGIES